MVEENIPTNVNIIDLGDDKQLRIETMETANPDNPNDVLVFKLPILEFRSIYGVNKHLTTDQLVTLVNAGFARNMRARATAALAKPMRDTGRKDAEGNAIMEPVSEQERFEARRKQLQEDPMLIDIEEAKQYRPGERTPTEQSLLTKVIKLNKEGKTEDAAAVLQRVLEGMKAKANIS